MKLVPLSAALALALTAASPAAAQTAAPVEAGVWSVTPFLSFTFGGPADSSSLGLGGAVGYDFSETLGVEGELAYVFDLIGDEESSDWSVTGLSANGLYHFALENGMAPYATAGLTFARSNRTVSDTTADTAEFGVNVGGGIKAPLSGNLVARGDIRYFKYLDAGPDGFRIYGGLTWKLRR